jgi:hypothetical protein
VPPNIQKYQEIDWKSLRILLEQQALEEEKNVKEHERTTGPSYYLQATGTYEDGPFCSLQNHKRGLFGCLWTLSGSMSNVVRNHVTNASAALRCPADADPMEFWLQSVFLSMRTANNERVVPAVHRLVGGLYLQRKRSTSRESLAESEVIIPRVYKASARFCSQFEEPALQAPISASEPARGQPPKMNDLTRREEEIWEVIQRGSKGLQYCRELESAGIRPRRQGIWKGSPSTYPAVYLQGAPWPHRIQDEKSKIAKKAQLAKTR